MPRPSTLVAALGLGLAVTAPLAALAAQAAAAPTAAGPTAVAPPAVAPPDHYPPTALGISYDSHRLDIVDPATGEVISGVQEGDTILDADYSSVRGRIFWAVFEDGGGVIKSAPVHHGGPAGVVAHGRRVAVSPDGRFLAYVSDPDGPGRSSLMEAVTVRDLDTGEERHFAGPPLPAERHEDLDDPIIDELAISPDSTRLAFDYFDSGEAFVVDLTSARTLADATPVTGVVSPRSPAWLTDDTLAVIDVEGAVRSIDLVTGAPLDVLLYDYAEELDADDAGRLVVKLDQPSEHKPGTPYVLVGTDGQVSRLRKPYHTMVW